jgi:hypothetical protein
MTFLVRDRMTFLVRDRRERGGPWGEAMPGSTAATSSSRLLLTFG